MRDSIMHDSFYMQPKIELGGNLSSDMRDSLTQEKPSPSMRANHLNRELSHEMNSRNYIDKPMFSGDQILIKDANNSSTARDAKLENPYKT